MKEIDPEFAVTAFNADYDQRRAACLARHDHALLQAFYASRARKISGQSRVLEFGCELTAGSFWLANSSSSRFVVADVTPDTLRQCGEQSQRRGVRDVQFVLLRHSQDVVDLATCDLFYSVLSLKHTSPTILVHLLSMLLSRITTDGVALVHAPTQHRHGTLLEPEIQLLPQWILYQTFEQLGFKIDLVQETVCYRSSDIIYHTFLAQRLFTDLAKAPNAPDPS